MLMDAFRTLVRSLESRGYSEDFVPDEHCWYFSKIIKNGKVYLTVDWRLRVICTSRQHYFN